MKAMLFVFVLGLSAAPVFAGDLIKCGNRDFGYELEENDHSYVFEFRDRSVPGSEMATATGNTDGKVYALRIEFARISDEFSGRPSCQQVKDQPLLVTCPWTTKQKVTVAPIEDPSQSKDLVIHSFNLTTFKYKKTFIAPDESVQTADSLRTSFTLGGSFTPSVFQLEGVVEQDLDQCQGATPKG